MINGDMDESRLKQLCVAVRDACDRDAVERAAEELRAFLREQQHITRTNLHPHIEKLFVALQADPDLAD